MKIKKMSAYFGALEGAGLELGEGLNILYAPNESGKSTWCAFLRAMLYGVNTAQRAKAGQKPDKVKYRPWSGAPMSGSMDLETENGPVTLRRWTEKAAQPMQAFSATVTGTGTPAAGLTSDNAGERLTGMPREVFERSVFIRQSGLAVTAEPELDKRINAIVSSGDEDVSYMETDKRLKTWLRHRRSGKRGALPELEEEMAGTRAALDRIRQASGTVMGLEEEIERAEEHQKELVCRMEQARRDLRQETLAAMSLARGHVQTAAEAQAGAAAALEKAERALEETPFGRMGPEEARRRSDIDRQNAQELAGMAEKLPPVKIAFIPLALAALAFVLALVLPWSIECIGAGCVLVLLFVVMYTRLSSIKKTKEETLADREKILTCYGVQEPEEIGYLLENYRVLWKERERAVFRMEEADAALEEARARLKKAEEQTLNGLDFLNGDNAAADAGRAVDAGKEHIAYLKERRAAAEGQMRAMGDAVVLETALAEQERRYEVLRAQEASLELAIEVLADADRELQQRFSPRLAGRAAELFSRLTDGRYDEVTLARDLTAKAKLTGEAVGWETDYLSEGTKDQLYLALRLAMCELALPAEDACPLILDDAFVSFDRHRMAAALDLLRELSGSRQILLFTCHEREYRYFEDDPAVTKLTLRV